jgi:hypothetical protein
MCDNTTPHPPDPYRCPLNVRPSSVTKVTGPGVAGAAFVLALVPVVLSVPGAMLVGESPPVLVSLPTLAPEPAVVAPGASSPPPQAAVTARLMSITVARRNKSAFDRGVPSTLSMCSPSCPQW